MLSRLVRVASRQQRCPRVIRKCQYDRSSSTWAGSRYEPLNILFCGADEFSIYSLRALRELQARRPEKIASIDVVCRSDKRRGRGLKQLHEVPIKPVANELGLRLHQIDTFTGWKPPDPVSIVVAVSFGLLVPARILNGATYGGVNVHPSLLPDLRGPAPMMHTLLKRREYTGVTLQTMHPTTFDKGAILAQTPAPGLAVPEDCTSEHLLELLGPHGARMLCDGIDNGLFALPVAEAGPVKAISSLFANHAPKITSEDRHVDWNSWTKDDIVLRDRVLGRLWDTRGSPSQLKRVVFEGPWVGLRIPDLVGKPRLHKRTRPGQLTMTRTKAFGHRVGFTTYDRYVVFPANATIDGGKKGRWLRDALKGVPKVARKDVKENADNTDNTVDVIALHMYLDGHNVSGISDSYKDAFDDYADPDDNFHDHDDFGDDLGDDF